MKPTRRPQSKIQLSARISPLARNLITLERDQGGWESDGEAVEALVLRASTSPEARKLMLAVADKNPLFAAIRNSLAVNSPHDSSARTVEQLAAVVNPLGDSAAKSGKKPRPTRPEAPAAGR
jgi:hypothetical protein